MAGHIERPRQLCKSGWGREARAPFNYNLLGPTCCRPLVIYISPATIVFQLRPPLQVLMPLDGAGRSSDGRQNVVPTFTLLQKCQVANIRHGSELCWRVLAAVPMATRTWSPPVSHSNGATAGEWQVESDSTLALLQHKLIKH